MLRALLLLCPCLLATGTVHAQRHTVYTEAFGKGGLYGLGYDYQLTPRFSVGAALSAYSIDDQRILSVSPYLGVHMLARGRHAWFTHVGPQLINQAIQSPVPRWNGEHSTSVGAQLSTGYEYRGRVVVRTFLMGVAGKGGASPWGGVSVGWSF